MSFTFFSKHYQKGNQLLCLALLLPARRSRISMAGLTVHLVPHSHDDCGWLKTFDSYYSGTNSSIQLASVRNILDAVVLSLSKDPSRRFTFVEQSFFQRWWSERDEGGRSATRELIREGRLRFANGGWCMHDEATALFVDMLDQTTLGHRMIADEFGPEAVPTVAWQIDPFGHSASQAALLSAEAGMDSLFFGRIDYKDMETRRASRSAEFIWRASPSLGADAQVFAGLTGEYRGNYVPPEGFDWTASWQTDDAVEDNPNVSSYNAPERVEQFLAAARAQANETRGQHIMWTMGADFTFMDAETHFANMDRLIRAVNKDGRAFARYSTPNEYVAAKRAERNTSWPLKNATDFFPYADRPNRVWAGYFTSRPTLKGFIRAASGTFGAARILHALASAASNESTASAPASPLGLLEDALAIASHHDAVTGTAKQHVVFDYARRLHAGVTQADGVIASSLNVLLRQDLAWRSCARMNETVCNATQLGGSIRIAIVNSLGQSRQEVVTVPVSSKDVSLTSATGVTVPVQVYAAGESVTNYKRETQEAALLASFVAQLPPLGAATYEMTVAGRHRLRRRRKRPRAAALLAGPHLSARTPERQANGQVPQANGNVTLSNAYLELNFSQQTGRLISMVNKAVGISASVDQTFCHYESLAGSGAYILRLENATCKPVTEAANITAVVRGEVVQEVRQTFAGWLTQTVRLGVGWRHAEFEHTVGPVPLSGDQHLAAADMQGLSEKEKKKTPFPLGPASSTGDPTRKSIGMEVVSRFVTSIRSAGEMLTDSNGREMMIRRRANSSAAEPIASSYFPVNTAAAIRGPHQQLTLLVDRAVGAASVTDGEIEIIVHRRGLLDDDCGLNEALDETQQVDESGVHIGPGLITRGSHRLTLERPRTAARVWRPLADRTYARPLLMFAQAEPSTVARPPPADYSALQRALPEHVQIITFQELRSGRLLLRVANQLGIDEDESLSQPAQVDLGRLFDPRALSIALAQRRSLTNTHDQGEMLRRRQRARAWHTSGHQHAWRRLQYNFSRNSTVTIGPMEILTFELVLQ